MEWDAKKYDQQHDFVSKYGENLLSYLPKNPRKILDIGCGTGNLTDAIAQLGHDVTGIDASATMIAQAQANFAGIPFQHADILTLTAENQYDLLFSNAVFHWIPEQDQLLQVCRQLLQKDGLLLCEFGAENNIHQIQIAFVEELHKLDISYHSPFYFPSTAEYRTRLEQNGFEILQLLDYDRPTMLKGEKNGLRTWIKQFFAADLEKLSHSEQEKLFANIEHKLKASLWKDDHWEADYRRIQVIARSS